MISWNSHLLNKTFYRRILLNMDLHIDMMLSRHWLPIHPVDDQSRGSVEYRVRRHPAAEPGLQLAEGLRRIWLLKLLCVDHPDFHHLLDWRLFEPHRSECLSEPSLHRTSSAAETDEVLDNKQFLFNTSHLSFVKQQYIDTSVTAQTIRRVYLHKQQTGSSICPPFALCLFE